MKPTVVLFINSIRIKYQFHQNVMVASIWLNIILKLLKQKRFTIFCVQAT